MTKHAGSFAGPKVGIVERIARVFRRIGGLWFRSIDQIPYRWRRFTDRVHFRWYTTVRGTGARIRTTLREAGRNRPAAPWVTTVAMLLLLVVLLGTFVVVVAGRPDLAAPEGSTARDLPRLSVGAPSSPQPSDAPLPGVNVHVNDQAGYLFSYPDGWDLTRSGAHTELSNPTGAVLMSFGTAAGGSLTDTTDAAIAGLARSYRNIEVSQKENQRTEQGQPSLVLGGMATDEVGRPISFLVVAIQGQTRNWSITIRLLADPTDSLQAIEEIVGSFRTSE